MRVGLAGTGRIGELHLRHLARHSAVRQVVLHDPDTARAEGLSRTHGTRAVPTFDDLLDQVDALVIASPTPTHPPLLRKAMAARIPVFTEKPVALTLREVDDLAAQESLTPSPVQVGFHYRFDPALRDLAEKAGAMSGPHFWRVHSMTEFAPSVEYLAQAGGLVADKLIHEIDMIRWMSGDEVIRVAALPGGVPDGPEPMTATVTLQLADGGLATIWGGYRSAAGFDLTVEVETPEAVLVVGNRRPASAHPTTVPVSTLTDFRERFTAAYAAELQTFVAVARGEQDSPCTLGEALRTHRLLAGAQTALRERRVVEMADGDPAGR